MAVLAAASLVFVLAQWRAEQEMLAREEATLAGVVAANAADALSAGQPGKVQVLLDTLRGSSRSAEAEFVDSQGRILARFARSNDPEPAGGARLGVVRAPVMVRGEKVGEVVLRAYDVRLASLFPRYLAVGGALFFAATGLALLMGQWLAARAIEPVERLSRAMQAVTEHGRYDRSVEVDADDEIGRLTDSFNDLLARLDANDRDLRAAMEQLVQARDAAEAANVLKSHFLANMSHEIRTPLNGVLGVAGALARTELGPRQREMVELIEDSANTLGCLLNDVLDLARIESGHLELKDDPFDLEDAVGVVAALFRAQARAKGLDFAVTVAPAARGGYRGDVVRLRQILANLLSNAVKFTERGGVAVRVEVARIEDGERLAITVRDTGVGIPADVKARLFRRFEQGDGSITRRFGGSGLGLAISRTLAQAMGGELAVESAPGLGSSFRLTVDLPRQAEGGDQEHARPEPAQSPALEDAAPPRVLLAEDNPANRRVVSLILEAVGAVLTCVENGAEAVAAAEAAAFDLVLMDMQMPVMDGLTAIRTIRLREAAAGLAPTPIYALTANALPEHVAASRAAGADHHLAKPISATALIDAVRAAVSVGAAREARRSA